MTRRRRAVRPDDIIRDGVAGTTHCGGFSFPTFAALLAERNAPVDYGQQAAAIGTTHKDLICSDWPSDYGTLNDRNITYNAHLLAMNYQGGVKQPVPLRTRLEWKQNADMWDCFLGMVIPFSGSDPDRRHLDYTFNPLDLFDRESGMSLSRDVATLDWDEIQKRHGAFYCAEGQYVVANLGPQDYAQLKKSEFGNTKIGQLIETFGKAPGLTPQTPEVGWQYLVDQGVITNDQLTRLKQTGRTKTYLTWIDEATPGWQEFEPTEPEGLIATPMTVATLAWSLLRRYMPREGVAEAVSQSLRGAYERGDATVKGAVTALLGGAAPDSAAGEQALEAFSFKASMAFIMSILSPPKLMPGELASTPSFKETMLDKAAFDEITNDDDKKKVTDMFDGFVQTVAACHDQASLDAALKAADTAFRDLKVERYMLGEDRQLVGRKTGLMLYAAPPCFTVWAQTPFMGNANVLQYVASAIHESLANP